MADTKFTALTAQTSVADTDIMVSVVDPTGTPVAKKTTFANIKATLKTYFDGVYQAVGAWTDSSTNTGTNKTLNSNTNYIDADATHLKVFLNIGRAGVVGDALYVTGWNIANSCVEVGLARANSTTTLPCAGVLESAGADGTIQSMRVEGILNNVNTNAWSSGTRLYVSAATAGVLTSTRPTSPNFDQAIATVSFQNATTGVLDVIRTAYVGTMAYGDTATYEVVANKATTFGTINDTLYPTVKAVNDAITTAVIGLLDYRGAYDASTNLFPATGGSGTAGAILKGDFWMCSVAGTLGGIGVTAGDLIIALQDTPAQTASNWDLIQHDVNNEYVTKALYDANTILYATSDNTPVALTVGTNTVVGRVAGAISALAIDADLSSVSGSDDTVPSAKATKAMGDLKLPLAGGTMTGKIVSSGSSEVGKTYTPATGAQTVALDCALNNVHVVSGHASGTAITFTIANATNSQPFIVSILQGSGTVSTIAGWFATVRWAGGVAPTLTATLDKRDTFGFIRTGANTYDGFVIGANC